MSKYHNRKVAEDGYTFDSIAEYNRYRELKIMQNNGDIKNLAVHPSYLLQEQFYYLGKLVREIKYIADFEYRDNQSQRIIVEDIKGVQTAEFKIKAKMFKKSIEFQPTIEFRLVQV